MSLVTMCRFLRTPAVSITISVFAFFFEAHVDAVARGAGHFRDDHPVAMPFVQLGDGVHQRALAGVALADDRHHHLRRRQLGRGTATDRRLACDRVEHLIDVAVVQRRDADRRAEPQAGKIAEHGVGIGAVGLVGDQHRLDAPPPQQRGDFLIGAGQPGLAIDDEQHQARLCHRHFDLMADVVGEWSGSTNP